MFFNPIKEINRLSKGMFLTQLKKSFKKRNKSVIKVAAIDTRYLLEISSHEKF